MVLYSFPTDQTSLGCLERSMQDTRHVSRPALDASFLLVAGQRYTPSGAAVIVPWRVCSQLHSVQVIKNSHAAAKAAGKIMFVVSSPKLLTPSLELKIVFMFRRFMVGLGKLLSS